MCIYVYSYVDEHQMKTINIFNKIKYNRENQNNNSPTL